jgi:serine phosphatase RsbU (regulator of sigma subunit)
MPLVFPLLSGSRREAVNFLGTIPGEEQPNAAVPSVDEIGCCNYQNYFRLQEPGNVLAFFIAGIMLFCAVRLAACILGISSVLSDYAGLRVEVAALFSGVLLPEEKKRRAADLSPKGAGLRLKLALFTICLVMVVVVMVSAPLYFRMIQTHRETLLKSLRERVSVLMETLASGVRVYLPSENILELSYLPAEITAVPEARYTTITGYNPETAVFDDLVLATNDPDILNKINTAGLEIGVSRLTDQLSPRIETLAVELNAQARSRVEGFAADIAALSEWAGETGVQASIAALENRLNEELAHMGREIGSEPVFHIDGPASGVSRNYIFFRPILYRHGKDDYYFRGLIRLEVSLDSILEQITRGKRVLQGVILLVALSAVVMGALGALLLSGLIIRPIRRLVRHVELIRDTEDTSRLEGIRIPITTNDELAVLGATINDMTSSLVRAAHASQDLIIGKEIQKKFIPLEIDGDGNKLTTGYKDTQYVQFFGYYEGAKGVSGDYFDYQDLDGRYFAVIKCDVAGKGVPAALIMIQVATMFLNHFKSWKPDAKGMHIEDVVYQINDFIEALGFKGRFAAFTLALFDSFTGLIRFCNAGDNIIHWFDASDRRMKTVTLRETPAAGILPNSLVESNGGYTVQTFTLASGDILFLYTDGIEEAKRAFRDASFKETACTEGDGDTLNENHAGGRRDEEMGAARVEAVINAVMNRDVYILSTRHNPEGDTAFTFDFTSCAGAVEEAVTALAAVEKIFRIYKPPSAGEETRILVDKKIDQFLKTHFRQYEDYCCNTQVYPDNDRYMYYTHVNEDAQYDDLTILGIKRK